MKKKRSSYAQHKHIIRSRLTPEKKIWYLACCKDRNTLCSDRLHMFYELVGAI